MVAMATNSNITVPQKYTAKYKNVGYGWDTSHPTTISKKFIILIYHYLHAVSSGSSSNGSSSSNVIRLFVFEGILNLLHCQFGLCKQGGGESAVMSAVEKHRDQQFTIRVVKRIEGCSIGHSSRDRCRGRPSRLQEAQ